MFNLKMSVIFFLKKLSEKFVMEFRFPNKNLSMDIFL